MGVHSTSLTISMRAVFVGTLALLAGTGCERAPDILSRCADLVTRSLPGIEIAASRVLEAADGLPEFCQVQGVIEPQIGFEARLPVDDWNGKYYQSGCGGYCGSVRADQRGFSNSINEALKRGYAAITTDGGHEGKSVGDASWAAGNRRAVEVYAHEGIALTHDAGTQLVEALYDSEPERHYFGGCSNGGRMAAMAAQRYPTLFDGILGGGSALNLSQSGGVYGSWVMQANTDAGGRRILTRENFLAKIPALAAAVLGQCDGTDGVVDGLISAPRACNVDVDLLPACDAADSAGCFTETEKTVLAKWYGGPRDSSGKQLFPGLPPGSERFAAFWALDSAEYVAVGNQLGGDFAKYLGFPDGTPGSYTALDFDFDRDPARLAKNGALLDALDPDLTAFRDAGGKYLMWHGWADPLVLPDQSLDYYEDVAREMGGYDEIRPFFRLFMMPGHGHCWELPGLAPDVFDPITVLDDWVERDEAPEGIVMSDGNGGETSATVCAHPVNGVDCASGQLE